MPNPNQYGFKPWSPEQIARNDAKVKENYETSFRVLGELAAKHGYVSVADMEALGLTPEQIKQIHWNSMSDNTRPNQRFYTADRKDGQKVKLIVTPVGDGDVFAADFFTPGFYEGHGGNHDFSHHELDGNMQLALENNYKK
jgi:hypothetical protein